MPITPPNEEDHEFPIISAGWGYTFSIKIEGAYRGTGYYTVHGEHIRPDDARSIVGIGIQVLEHIDSIIEEFMVKPIKTKPISSSEVQACRDAKYRVTTIIPLIQNPVRNVRILDQEGTDTLLEGYDEYAEFLVSIERIDTTDDINQ